MKSLFSILLPLSLTACMADNLPKYNQLESLRILALVASAPEVDAGGSTTITPIVSDVNETTALSFEATGCISYTSADSSCSGNATAVSIQTGTLNSGDMTAAKGFTGAATAIAVNIPAAGTIFNQRSTQDQFNGVSYLVTYLIRNSRGESVQSYRRIVVSTRAGAEKNQNPILSDILLNGAVMTTTLPGSNPTSITPSFGATLAESYRVQTTTGDYRTENEAISTSWFSSAGQLKYYRSIDSEENIFTAPESLPTGRDVYLLAVTRDGRGGIAYKRKCFGTCP